MVSRHRFPNVTPNVPPSRDRRYTRTTKLTKIHHHKQTFWVVKLRRQEVLFNTTCTFCRRTKTFLLEARCFCRILQPKDAKICRLPVEIRTLPLNAHQLLLMSSNWYLCSCSGNEHNSLSITGTNKLKPEEGEGGAAPSKLPLLSLFHRTRRIHSEFCFLKSNPRLLLLLKRGAAEVSWFFVIQCARIRSIHLCKTWKHCTL